MATPELPGSPGGVCLIATSSLTGGRDLVGVVNAAIDGGAALIQLREKDLPDDEIIGLAERMRRLTADRGVPFIINDRADLALAVEADGVHVGQDDEAPERIRDRPGWTGWIGLSTHTADQVRDALARGVDMLGFGPVFATSTKDAGAPRGVEAAAEAAVLGGSLPVFAIGGIDEAGAKRLAAAGVGCAAVSSAILRASDPAEETARIVRALKSVAR